MGRLLISECSARTTNIQRADTLPEYLSFGKQDEGGLNFYRKSFPPVWFGHIFIGMGAQHTNGSQSIGQAGAAEIRHRFFMTFGHNIFFPPSLWNLLVGVGSSTKVERASRKLGFRSEWEEERRRRRRRRRRRKETAHALCV